MERMPLIILMFYSVPESILLISLGARLYGYDVRENIGSIVKLSLSLAAVTYMVRFLPFGWNALLETPVFILLTAYFLKTGLFRSFLIIFTGLIAIALAENLVYPIISMITGLEISYIFQNDMYRLLVGWILLAVLGIFNAIVIKRGLTYFTAINFIKGTNLNTKITILIMVTLFQAFLAGTLQIVSYIGDNGIFPVFLTSQRLKLTIGVSLITIPIVSIFILKRLIIMSEKETVATAQDAFIESINSLFLTIRAQRHDFINHVQVLYSLLQLGKNGEAAAYMESTIDGINEVNELIKLNNPGLAALINTNLAIAEAKNIRFETNIEASFESVGVKSIDLIKIIGNLIRNAIEAVELLPVEERLIKVTMKKISSAFVVEVLNFKPVISQEMLCSIFQSGFSTKKQEHSGIGLAIVKKLVEKYNGQIGVKSDDTEGTVFTVVIPE